MTASGRGSSLPCRAMAEKPGGKNIRESEEDASEDMDKMRNL